MTTTNTTRALDAKLHEALYGGEFQRGDTWITEVDAWVGGKLQRLEVPYYHADLIAIHVAETALPVALREDYASELINEIVDREDLRGIAPYPARDDYEKALAYRGFYALIHASAEQRATALIAVLERAKEAK